MRLDHKPTEADYALMAYADGDDALEVAEAEGLPVQPRKKRKPSKAKKGKEPPPKKPKPAKKKKAE